MGQRVTAVLLIGFVAGILLRSFVDFGIVFACLFIFIGAVFLLLSYVKREGQTFAENKGLTFALCAFFLIMVGIGMFRYNIKDSDTQNNFNESIGRKVSLNAVIVEEPEEREKYNRLVVESDGNKILIYSNQFPKFNYGDAVKIKGVLKKPENLDMDFDWKNYLAKDEIYFEMLYPEINFISSGNGSRIKAELFALKNNFLESVGENISEPDAAFIGGITVGAKSSIPRELTENLKKSGVMHIVVLSGYNITIVADYAMRLFRFLPYGIGIFAGIISIIFFAIMTGASATVIRASIMAVLVLVARATGRLYTASWALVLAGVFMVLHNPKILRFDSSFQLSFLATLGLILLSPYLEEKLKFITKKYKIREAVCSTLAAQIFVLPLLLFKTGLLSIVSLPVNLLVVMFIPITMFFGFLAGGFGMISAYLAIPVSWLAYFFTRYELGVINWSAKIPYTAIDVCFPFWIMTFIYFAYALFFLKLKIYKNEQD